VNKTREALRFAVEKEKEAESFYASWSAEAREPAVRKLFAELAEMERGHVERLSRIDEEQLVPSGESPRDLGLAALLVDVPAEPGLTLQEAFVVAIKREQAAIDLYEGLSHAGGPARATMEWLAEEERRHRRLLEDAYEKAFLAEN